MNRALIERTLAAMDKGYMSHNHAEYCAVMEALKAKLEQAMEAGLDFEGRAYRAEKKLAEYERRYPKSAAETHPMIPNSKCKCEHWQRCPECTPSLKGTP